MHTHTRIPETNAQKVLGQDPAPGKGVRVATGLRPAVGKGRDGWQKNTSKNIKDLHSAAAQGKRTARRRLVKVGAAFHCIQIKISNIIQ